MNDDLEIRNEEDYRKAVLRFMQISNALPGSMEREEALFLCRLMREYEERCCREMRCGNVMN